MPRAPYHLIPREFMPIRIPNSNLVQIRWKNPTTLDTYLLFTVPKSSFYNHSYNSTYEGFVEEAYQKYGAQWLDACIQEGLPIQLREVV